MQALHDEARALRQVIEPLPPAVAEFLDGVSRLPVVAPRTLYRHTPRRAWLTAAQWLQLAESERTLWKPHTFDAMGYYSTFYGSPLAYALALNVAARHGMRTLRGQRVVDYGYGAMGPVRLMVQAGADVIGIDVDPMLTLLYGEAGDTGAVAGGGRAQLLNVNFPDDASRLAIGREVTLFLSKNTLKKGYLRPDVGEAQIKPPVSLPAYLSAVRDTLAPGALFVIYNISQRLDPANYRPANDPRSPFTRDEFEAARFDVLALDADDSVLVRRAGKALGWDAPPNAGGMGDLETNLFAFYTVARAKA